MQTRAGDPRTFITTHAPFGPFSSHLLVSAARFAMSHIFISLDRSCTVVDTGSAQNGYKGSRNGRFLPPSRTERGPVGLAAPGRVPRGGQLALLPPRGRARGGTKCSRELGQRGLHEVPGTRRVRRPRPGRTRAVRRVGRTDRGRARRTDGPGASPAGVGTCIDIDDVGTRFTDGIGGVGVGEPGADVGRRARRFEQLKERFFTSGAHVCPFLFAGRLGPPRPARATAERRRRPDRTREDAPQDGRGPASPERRVPAGPC